MAFEFPDAPTDGETYDIYTWDGEKWSLSAVIGEVFVAEFVELFGVVHLDQLIVLEV